tara:strand:+ start:869 stop:1474 length:606 start_codon:yes stop_codon:yes gene_type:complete
MKFIIICGPSGSGKTTLGINLLREIKNSYLLSTDNYYKTGLISKILSKIINSYFDRKISFNIKLLRSDIYEIIKNKKIKHNYKYNFKKKLIKKSFQESNFIDFLIVEGIFAEEVIKYIPKEDYLIISLKMKKSFCLKRIILRDILERGKSESKSIMDFHKGWLLFKEKEKSICKYPKKNKLIFNNTPDLKIIVNKLFKENL